MPIVSKRETILPDKTRFIKVVKYNPIKEKQSLAFREHTKPYFSIELPEAVKIFSQKQQVTGETEGAVEAAFKEIVAEYARANKKVQKFIVFKLETSISRKDIFGNNDNRKKLKLTFNWGVYTRTQIGDNVRFSYAEIGDEVLNSWEQNKNIEKEDPEHTLKFMEWSEGRQKWCEDFYTSFAGIIEKIESFTRENNNNQFAKLMDSSKANLLNYTPTKK